MLGLKASLFLNENSALLEFANLTTFPNIREGLRVFKVFLNSGHTKIEEYISRSKNINSRPHQVIPIHEFVKSVALQNRHYYNSETSIIYNIFKPPHDSQDHFIKLYILKDLSELIENHTYTDKFVRKSDFVEKLISLGYRLNTIHAALHSLIKAALLDTDEQLSDVEWENLPDEFNLTLTAKGYYYLNILSKRFLYQDLVFQDTPVYNQDFYNELIDVFPHSSKEGNRNFELRKQFILKFWDYLEMMEVNQGNQIRTIYGFIRNMKTSLLEEIERMKQ